MRGPDKVTSTPLIAQRDQLLDQRKNERDLVGADDRQALAQDLNRFPSRHSRSTLRPYLGDRQVGSHIASIDL